MRYREAFCEARGTIERRVITKNLRLENFETPRVPRVQRRGGGARYYTCEREKEEKDVVVSTFLLSARLLRFLERHPWRRGVTRERVVLAASIVID